MIRTVVSEVDSGLTKMRLRRNGGTWLSANVPLTTAAAKTGSVGLPDQPRARCVTGSTHARHAAIVMHSHQLASRNALPLAPSGCAHLQLGCQTGYDNADEQHWTKQRQQALIHPRLENMFRRQGDAGGKDLDTQDDACKLISFRSQHTHP